MPRSHTFLPIFILAVLLLSLSGCGDDESSDSFAANSNGATSNGSTATSNGTTATSNGTNTTSNGTATSNGTTATSNGTTSTSNGTTSTSNGTTGGNLCNETDASNTLLAEGEYFVAAKLAGLGLNVFFQIKMVAADDRLITFELKALSADKSFISEPLVTLCDTPIDGDGKFTMDLGSFFMPGEATPTGTSVELANATFQAQILDNTSVCGGIGGQLPLLNIDLEGTTFKAVPFGTESVPPEDSCEGSVSRLYDPIETCPALAAGANTMVSAELDREFTIYQPSDIGEDETLPVVFLHHGLGGESVDLVNATGFGALVDTERFILIAPEGANTEDGGRVFATEWSWIQPLFDTDNQDLVFFDDMLKCVGEQYDIDMNRIYAAGMSAGGLWTTFLTVNRGEVLAATAPFSGGYTHASPKDYTTIPVMYSWGGENDTAVDTNFNDLAMNTTAAFEDSGHYMVVCNHGQEHTWPSELTMPAWMMLSAVTKGDDDAPFVDTLPDAFPDYCTIGISE